MGGSDADSIGRLTALLAFPALGVSFSHLEAHPDLGLFLLPVVAGSAFQLPVALVEILGRVSPQYDNKRADPIFRVGANVHHCGLARLILIVLTAARYRFSDKMSNAGWTDEPLTRIAYQPPIAGTTEMSAPAEIGARRPPVSRAFSVLTKMLTCFQVLPCSVGTRSPIRGKPTIGARRRIAKYASRDDNVISLRSIWPGIVDRV